MYNFVIPISVVLKLLVVTHIIANVNNANQLTNPSLIITHMAFRSAKAPIIINFKVQYNK